MVLQTYHLLIPILTIGIYFLLSPSYLPLSPQAYLQKLSRIRDSFSFSPETIVQVTTKKESPNSPIGVSGTLLYRTQVCTAMYLYL